MAISPSSDLVLGVSQAADPDKVRTAAERLRRLSEAAASSAGTAPAASSQAETRQPAAGGLAARVPVATTVPGKTSKRVPEAFSKLEAFILQNFIQGMLPKNAKTVFGKGISGEFWRSMLAEKLGGELARSGQVGLAAKLAAQSPQAAAGGAPADAPANASVATRTRNALPYLNAPLPETDAPAPATSSPADRS